MSLPPLPTTIYVLANPGGRWEQGYTLIDSAYTEEQMQIYGQQCRAEAIEEAAMAAENGFKYALDGYQIADKIRSLK